MFFPITVIAYFLCPKRGYRNGVLLAASLFFYAWGSGPKFLALILAAVAAAYAGGLIIDGLSGKNREKLRKAVFIITVALLLSNLFIFKYLNFTVRNLELLFGRSFALKELILPIGISFYTFQILSYVIDLYRGKVAVQRNPVYLLLYVSFFPQLIAGPIVRYETVQNEIVSRRENLDEVSYGLKRFIIGLSKKLIIANNVAKIAEIIYAGDPALYGTAMYWVAALAYTLQIYFDFSGYSDMAIGIGRMFGFHFLENFDNPYISCSVTEFWRRWHISLSTWFRDYVYIPLGGNRVSQGKWLRNIMIVWLLTGIWHGAEWNFIIWGLYYGVLLVIEKLFLGRLIAKLPKAVGWIYTFVIVNVGWVIFNITNAKQLFAALRLMFVPHATMWLDMFAQEITIVSAFAYIPLGLICMLPLRKLFKPAGTAAGELLHCAFFGILLGICIMFTVSSSYNPFIYFRF